MRRRYRSRSGRWRWDDDDDRRPIEISFNFGRSTTRTETKHYYDEDGRKVVTTTTTSTSDGVTPAKVFDAFKAASRRAKDVILDPDALDPTDADGPADNTDPQRGDGIVEAEIVEEGPRT